MSDADSQMGGQGGETGRAPGQGDNPAEDAKVEKESKDSFPASDPPANY